LSYRYRMTVSSMDEEGNEKARETTGIKQVSLGKDEVSVI